MTETLSHGETAVLRNILDRAEEILGSEDVWDGGSEGRGEVTEEIVHRLQMQNLERFEDA